MRLTSTFDARNFYRRLKHMNAARPKARAAAARDMGRHIITYINVRGARDTNRFVRGWIMAGNDAGVTNLPVPSVQKSGRHDKFVEAMMEQALWWKDYEEKLQTAYSRMYGYRDVAPTANGRKRRGAQMPPGQRELLARLRKAEANRRRAFQELERVTEHADRVIVVGLYSTVNRGFTKGGRTLTRTTRHKVYGGSGRVYDTDTATWLILHNKEPHATIVERNTKVFAKASVAAKALGLKSASASYMREVRRRGAAA